MNWGHAINYLNMLIAEYSSIGWAGQFGLQLVLLPLKRRIDAGERTEALYNKIMECK